MAHDLDVITQDLIDKGFKKVLFDKEDDQEFFEYVGKVVTARAAAVKAHVGAAVYASEDADVSAAVDDAIGFLARAELWELRKMVVLSSVAYSGEQHQRAGISEENSKKAAMDEFEESVARALTLSGIAPEFSTGSVVTSHFPEAAS